MPDKSAGIDFDRQVFVQQQTAPARPAARMGGAVFAVVIIAVVVFAGYKLLSQNVKESANADSSAVAGDIDKRLASIEERLEKLEAARKASVVSSKREGTVVADPKPEPAKPAPSVRTTYQVSPSFRQPTRTASAAAADPATAQRIAAMQQSLGALQSDAAASRDAWQATTDKLADMQGRVGTQGVEILRSQDELNQLLARTEMEAIPFELLRGSNPQPVGPVSFVLKSANPKTKRYTMCVYIQPSCIELKDKTLNEVVQFVVSRNTTPLEVIATRMTKDEITGYLEVPRDQSAH